MNLFQLKQNGGKPDAALTSLPEAQGNEQEEAEVKPAPLTTEQLVRLIVDAQTLAAQTAPMYQQLILPCFSQLGIQDHSMFEGGQHC